MTQDQISLTNKHYTTFRLEWSENKQWTLPYNNSNRIYTLNDIPNKYQYLNYPLCYWYDMSCPTATYSTILKTRILCLSSYIFFIKTNLISKPYDILQVIPKMLSWWSPLCPPSVRSPGQKWCPLLWRWLPPGCPREELVWHNVLNFASCLHKGSFRIFSASK